MAFILYYLFNYIKKMIYVDLESLDYKKSEVGKTFAS